MAVVLNPITLPNSKMISTMTALIADVRFRETLAVSDLVYDLVSGSRVGNVDYGKGIVYNFKVGLLPVKDLSEVSSAFSITKPNVAQETLEIDEYKFIPISFSNYLGKDAFTRGYQFDGFFSFIMSLIGETHQFTLYDVVNNMIQSWTPGQATQTVSIDQIDTSTLVGEARNAAERWNATQIAKVMRKTINNMKVLNSGYSDVAQYTDENDGTKKNVMTALATDNMRCIFNDNYYTDFLGDAMASLYHNKVIGEMIPGETFDIIPTSKMTTANAKTIAWVCDKQKFALADFYAVTLSILDPSTLYENNFFHYAYGAGVMKHAPAVKFVANVVAPPTPSTGA